MTTPRRSARRSLLVALVIALVMGPFVAWQGAQGDGTRPVSRLAPHGIVVVGDSITARYNDEPGDPDQGWWSVTGRRFDADVRTYAGQARDLLLVRPAGGAPASSAGLESMLEAVTAACR